MDTGKHVTAIDHDTPWAVREREPGQSEALDTSSREGTSVITAVGQVGNARPEGAVAVQAPQSLVLGHPRDHIVDATLRVSHPSRLSLGGASPADASEPGRPTLVRVDKAHWLLSGLCAVTRYVDYGVC